VHVYAVNKNKKNRGMKMAMNKKEKNVMADMIGDGGC
jgi:hypothetical protein